MVNRIVDSSRDRGRFEKGSRWGMRWFLGWELHFRVMGAFSILPETREEPGKLRPSIG